MIIFSFFPFVILSYLYKDLRTTRLPRAAAAFIPHAVSRQHICTSPSLWSVLKKQLHDRRQRPDDPQEEKRIKKKKKIRVEDRTMVSSFHLVLFHSNSFTVQTHIHKCLGVLTPRHLQTSMSCKEKTKKQFLYILLKENKNYTCICNTLLNKKGP